MKSIKLLSVTMLATIATPAFAANWVYVLTNDTGTVYYYDSDTIQRSGQWVIVWEKWDHSRDKTVPQREQKIRWRYDCAGRTSTPLQLTKYFPNRTNETITWETYQQKAAAIIPETVGEAQLKAVCAATVP